MPRFEGQTIAIVGGGSGIGKAIARALADEGARTILSSRNYAKLELAARSVGGSTVSAVDMTDNGSITNWTEGLPAIDHLVISASSAAHGPFMELAEDKLRAMFDAKFFGPYLTAKAALPKLRDGGSICFFSGVLSRRPGINCSGLGAVNGAVESLTYGLALELGPKLRVNCLSPGMVCSDAYGGMEPDAREAMYQETGASLPVARVGEVEDLAQAALYLLENRYTTGVVLDVDGGHMIRQYATRSA